MKTKMQRLLVIVAVLVLGIAAVQAARLPVVGEDENNWGTLLNEFLLVSHTAGGYLADFYVNGSNITFEGATNDDINLILKMTNPTANRTVTFPDASGEVCLLGQTIESSEIADGTITGGDLASDIAITTTGNIILDSPSQLKIADSSDTFYGIFAVDDLTNNGDNAIYTFPETPGNVVVAADDGSGNNVAVSGLTIDNTAIGDNVPSTGIFTTLTANENTILGDTTDDKVTINDLIGLVPRDSAPVSPILGDIYVDSTTSELCFYDGTAWQGIISNAECA